MCGKQLIVWLDRAPSETGEQFSPCKPYPDTKTAQKWPVKVWYSFTGNSVVIRRPYRQSGLRVAKKHHQRQIICVTTWTHLWRNEPRATTGMKHCLRHLPADRFLRLGSSYRSSKCESVYSVQLSGIISKKPNALECRASLPTKMLVSLGCDHPRRN